MAENEILHNTPHKKKGIFDGIPVKKKKRIFDEMPIKKDLIDLDIYNIINKDKISDNNDLRDLSLYINNLRTKKRILDEMPVKKDLIDLDISNITNKDEISDNNDLRELLSLIDNPRTKKRIFSKIDEVQHTIKGQTLNKNKLIFNQK